MRKLILTLLITIPAAWLTPAKAQLFGRKNKTPVEQRLPELLYLAKADPDERKRAAAAGELGAIDGKAHPEVAALLADIARSDPKASVRHEAIQSLAQLRPISAMAGQTLEWSAANDDTWKNRWQAKSLLLRYQLAGYQAGKADPKPDPKTQLPPMTVEPPALDQRDAKARPTINFPNFGRPMPSKSVPATTTSKTPAAPSAAKQPTPAPFITPPPVVIQQQPSSAPPIQPAPPVVIQQPAPPSPQPAPPVVIQNSAPPSVIGQPTPPPVIVTPSAPPAIAIEPLPPGNKATTPAAPKSSIEPAPLPLPLAPPLNLDVPGLSVEPAPKLAPPPPVKISVTLPPASPSAPSAPVATEPNFRPAGQTPPRPGAAPAAPRAPTPTPAKDDSGPALTPPM